MAALFVAYPTVTNPLPDSFLYTTSMLSVLVCGMIRRLETVRGRTHSVWSVVVRN